MKVCLWIWAKEFSFATLRDDQLGDIPREKLEKTLQKASGEIIDIVRKTLSRKEFLLNGDYTEHDEDCSVRESGEISESILEGILKDYPYLKYDELYSKPPDVLKCHVANPKTPRQAEDIFEIERRLRNATGREIYSSIRRIPLILEKILMKSGPDFL